MKPKISKPKPKPKAPEIKQDQPRWGSARVHTAKVDEATAAAMQACGYRIESKSAGVITVFGDAAALETWRATRGR